MKITETKLRRMLRKVILEMSNDNEEDTKVAKYAEAIVANSEMPIEHLFDDIGEMSKALMKAGYSQYHADEWFAIDDLEMEEALQQAYIEANNLQGNLS